MRESGDEPWVGATLTEFPGDATPHITVADEQHDMTLAPAEAGLLADAPRELVALAGQAREEVQR